VGPGQTYATIQAAVDAARPGDGILVYPSTYMESVSVTKGGISIVAQGSGVIVSAYPAEGKACFEVKADRVVIHGFGLTGTNMAPGIRFEGSYNRFSGNRIYDLNGPGVNALNCRDPNGGSDYNVIADNDVSGADLGIIVGSESRTAVNKENTIIGNHINGMGSVGIGIHNCIGCAITGNVIEGVEFGLGISVVAQVNSVPQHSIAVAANKISQTAEGGIGVFADQTTSLSKVTLSHNAITSPGRYGILLQKDQGAHLTDNMISDNWISEAQDAGILVDDSVNKNKIESNIVLGGAIYGIQVNGNHNKIRSNTALENGTYDLVDGGKGNQWKDNAYEFRSWGP
jgi:parallel beta-helix repeat protein